MYSLNISIKQNLDRVDKRFQNEDMIFIENLVEKIRFDKKDIKKAELQKGKVLCLGYYDSYYHKDICKVVFDYIDKTR